MSLTHILIMTHMSNDVLLRYYSIYCIFFLFIITTVYLSQATELGKISRSADYSYKVCHHCPHKNSRQPFSPHESKSYKTLLWFIQVHLRIYKFATISNCKLFLLSKQQCKSESINLNVFQRKDDGMWKCTRAYRNMLRNPENISISMKLMMNI